MIISKIVSIILFLLTLFVFSSCDRVDTDTDESKNDLISDTHIDTNVNIDSNIDSNITDGSQNITGDSQGDKDDLQSDTEIKEIIDTFGNFTTLHKTLASNDRMKQMKYSKSVFNTGSKYTPDELKSTRLQANIIASAKIFFPNASDFMDHYLEGNGEIYELDIDDFLENDIAKQNMYKDINEALRATEEMVIDGEKITVYQIEESLHHNLTGDWKYSVGSYFASVELYDVKETSWFGVTYYTAKLKYVVQDFYNWDANDTNDISITSVSPADLHQLHINGEAQEFLTYGEEEYEIKWVKGVDASTIKFNDKE